MRRLPRQQLRLPVLAVSVAAAVAFGGLLGAVCAVGGVSVLPAAVRRQRQAALTGSAVVDGGGSPPSWPTGALVAAGGGGRDGGGGGAANGTATRLDVLDSAAPCLYDVLLPGTHDSSSYTMTTEVVPRGAHPLLQRPWIRRLLSAPLAAMSVTQGARVLTQLRAGARYLDLRVGKVAGDRSTWWMIHGMVACAPFAEAVADINAFHREGGGTVVWVIREERFAPGESAALAAYLRATVEGTIYDGDQAGLRRTPFRGLPPNVIFGVAALTPIPALLAVDEWVNTYSSRVKIPVLLSQMSAASTRHARDTLMVIGWTLTPQPVDIALRVLTFNVGRPSIREAAAAMNRQVYPFLRDHRGLTLRVANVIFFDWMGAAEAEAVLAMNRGVFVDEVPRPPTPAPVPPLVAVGWGVGAPPLPTLPASPTPPPLGGATAQPLPSPPSPSSSPPPSPPPSPSFSRPPSPSPSPSLSPPPTGARASPSLQTQPPAAATAGSRQAAALPAD
ncbi:hypothetical protein I4F81_005620 [Pyropia yezoensis]|uniref:Uncharacterized protein n=1 Tax=Pyropia yezoensis TaxID=2788 RepID=A0ACC3BYD7_PYRYE|nr:hypothetical protein I4F81_005620 [Neopyropia yezoensis]